MEGEVYPQKAGADLVVTQETRIWMEMWYDAGN